MSDISERWLRIWKTQISYSEGQISRKKIINKVWRKFLYDFIHFLLTLETWNDIRKQTETEYFIKKCKWSEVTPTNKLSEVVLCQVKSSQVKSSESSESR